MKISKKMFEKYKGKEVTLISALETYIGILHSVDGDVITLRNPHVIAGFRRENENYCVPVGRNIPSQYIIKLDCSEIELNSDAIASFFSLTVKYFD